jgi:ubiquinone/menaquinone biosynthesis C-methylase UbiE
VVARLFKSITAVYTGPHAWIYETMVAPAVYESRQSRQIIDERFLQHLPQGARILDVGAGGGLFTNYIADQRPDLIITGIDLSEPQLKRASKRMRAYADRVTFQSGDATRMAFADRSFDGVISYGSIKHWTSREAGIAECVRVLKPAGPLLINDADRGVTYEDAQNFITHYKAPRLFDGINLAMFRTWIAGRSVDLDDLRALANREDLVDVDVSRVPDSVLVMISARRADT